MPTDASRFQDSLVALCSPHYQARSQATLKREASRRITTISDMHAYMHHLGLVDKKLPINSFIDTRKKGKGSMACMCEAILVEKYNLSATPSPLTLVNVRHKSTTSHTYPIATMKTRHRQSWFGRKQSK